MKPTRPSTSCVSTNGTPGVSAVIGWEGGEGAFRLAQKELLTGG